jgi:hypothetical protein
LGRIWPIPDAASVGLWAVNLINFFEWGESHTLLNPAALGRLECHDDYRQD